MFCDKHNINLAVFIFLKTYVCKHKSKHKIQNIEPKPTQKNWPIDCFLFDSKATIYYALKNHALFVSVSFQKSNAENHKHFFIEFNLLIAKTNWTQSTLRECSTLTMRVQ